MRLVSFLRVVFLPVSIALLVVFSPVGVNGGPAKQSPKAQPNLVAVDAGDIAGAVSGPKGPEAGVWVIAETTDLPTKFRKIVVTNDQGRFLLPDLPKANYKVWVRGYGLVDSEPVQAAPGKTVSLKAKLAPSAQAAAQYYPSNYWL